ncbi:hypothetical protein QBC44DRAFT_328857 [Cladorrhinum sp. PSN332]|nr:hypothetical protein QBC44DRAFT_328857 [Cladorrhinum sp. PSN332]
MASPPSPERKPGLKVIHAALFRMGTKSSAEAYKLLGYKVHHGLLEDVTETPWAQIEQAAEATWGSSLPLPLFYPPRPPFARQDWDALFGSKYDIATDLASFFVIDLIKAYPEAKVVIVQRPFEKWWPSFRGEVLDSVMHEPMATINGWIGWNVMGMRAVQAMMKLNFGFFGAKTVAEIEERKKEVYDRYFEEIRRIVPEENRLEYKMGDGWEPLCEFLGVPVPVGVEFPNSNEQEAHQEEMMRRRKKMYKGAIKMFGPWVVLAGAVALGWRWYSQI